jgi:N-acetylmuramoyl-L-alanine amidase
MIYKLVTALISGTICCAVQLVLAAEVGQELRRTGDEIMVCGKLFHTTTPVVLWTDPGGYDAYRTERRFSSFDKASWEETIKDVPGFPNYGPVR